ncbi:hypothetical protein NEFER03_1710 [Nematocida sp. LUAm3]|nr:hypothetical protein NEFER03_1710 [Nematocida sp. LUAm3]KAI5175700.1 hypothetical protein NEFER02_1587 [Nematocida sp. LUAm2]KAI5178606.1 hypothetical protein NEFER01_1742 [Nematocida sp. LUAm1]
MLAAVLLCNVNGAYVLRPLMEMPQEKVSRIIETYFSHKSKAKESKGTLNTGIGSFFYQDNGTYQITVLGEEEEVKVFKGLSVLEGVISTLSSSFTLEEESIEISNILMAIDEIFTAYGVVDRQIEDLIKVCGFQSNDEVLHQIMRESQEKEKEKLEKMHRKVPALEELSKEIEQIKELKEDLKNIHILKEQKKEKPLSFSLGKKLIDTYKEKINIISYQKYTSIINSSNDSVKTEGTGELLIRIEDEEASLLQINLKTKPKTSRIHPSIDKKSFSLGKILPKTEIPISRILTLLKWTEESPSIPIEVSFWQSDLSEERYKFFIEITALENILSASIKLPVKRVSDVDIKNGELVDEHIISETKEIEKDSSYALEFTGLCDDISSLFPISVTYLCEQKNTLLPVSLESIHTGDPNHPIPPSDILLSQVIEGECSLIEH